MSFVLLGDGPSSGQVPPGGTKGGAKLPLEAIFGLLRKWRQIWLATLR